MMYSIRVIRLAHPEWAKKYYIIYYYVYSYYTGYYCFYIRLSLANAYFIFKLPDKRKQENDNPSETN